VVLEARRVGREEASVGGVQVLNVVSLSDEAGGDVVKCHDGGWTLTGWDILVLCSAAIRGRDSKEE
jgi:hypothetical protein